MERFCGGMLETAPPRPGASLKRNSCGLNPASADTRSPSASRRVSWACICPSLTAMAFRFSRRKSRVFWLSCCCAERTSDWSCGMLNSSAWRTDTQKIAAASPRISSAKKLAPARRCAVVSVTDFALASRLETRIMCMLHLPTRRMTMHPHKPDALLSGSDGIPSLMPQARRLLELRQLLVELLPEALARSCTVANYKHGKLVVFAENNAI